MGSDRNEKYQPVELPVGFPYYPERYSDDERRLHVPTRIQFSADSFQQGGNMEVTVVSASGRREGRLFIRKADYNRQRARWRAERSVPEEPIRDVVRTTAPEPREEQMGMELVLQSPIDETHHLTPDGKRKPRRRR